MKLVVRVWREETDERKARSLRGAKDWDIDTHAPSRMPTDYLPTAVTLMGPRIPREATAAQERDLWSKAVGNELKCEGGGGRLPISRSAIPAGSQARMLLTYIRLVEGGRLKARREASMVGIQNRRPHEDGDAAKGQAHRGWGGRVTCELAGMRPYACPV